ncbi:glycosyltransferase family 4 protein [Chloroflexota bacterium]
MNILFIHEIDWLRKVVFEIHTLSELLSLSGHRVYAIDYESMWVKDNPLDLGSLSTAVVNKVARSYPGASVSLIRPGFIKIPGLSRLSAAFTHYREIRRTIREKDIDVIILYSIPTNGLQAIHLAKKFGIPVVFRSIDILNQLVPNPILSPITRVLERKIYSGADLILTISPRLSRYVTAMGAKEDKVKLLLLGIDTKLFKPDIDSKELRQKWGFGTDDPVIVFVGTLFDFSGLDAFIRQFPQVRKKIPAARLLIVGDGPQRPKLENIISDMALQKHVVITGFQPYETMPRYINMASICINTFLTTDATRDIFPTKIIQYLACGKPVLATSLPGLKAVAPGEEQGIIYAGDPGDMAADTVLLLESGTKRQQLGQAALDYVKQAHSYDIIVQQLEMILGELSGKKKA